jgi:methylase of polypeptide subunit release factors
MVIFNKEKSPQKRADYDLDHLDIRYIESEWVYPVKEDSLLLLESAAELIDHYEPDRLLDMGCGTGIVTLMAARKGVDVISVDREPRALLNLRESLRINDLNARLLLSDLYEGIPRSYLYILDMAIFNPPYLETDSFFLDRRADLPLIGGKNGWETAGMFLGCAARLLKPDGKALIIEPSSWGNDWYLDYTCQFSRTRKERSVDVGDDVLHSVVYCRTS